MTAAKDGVLIRRRLRIFAAAVALVLLCAVCVGGVSGAVSVTTWDGLYNAIESTPLGGSVEIIIGTASSRDIQIAINSDALQLNIKGKTVIISNYRSVNVVFMKSGNSNNLNIFEIGSATDDNGNTYAGSLTLNGVSPGSITLDRDGRWGDLLQPYGTGVEVLNGGTFIMNGDVTIQNQRVYASDEAAGVHVRTGGTFIMNGGIITDNIATTAWGGSAQAGGVFIEEDATFSMSGDSDISGNSVQFILSAWGSEVNFGGAGACYTVCFEQNDGSGVKYYQLIQVNTATPLGKNTYVRDGYTFKNWNTLANGKGISYADEASVTDLSKVGGTFTLYAQWTRESYTLEFDTAGGSPSTISPITAEYGASISVPEVTKDGFAFTGWLDEFGNLFTSLETMPDCGDSGDTMLLTAQWFSDLQYTISIPDVITVNTNDQSAKISVELVSFPAESSINVVLNEKTTLKHEDSPSVTLEYVLYANGWVVDNTDVVATFSLGQTDAVIMTAELAADAVPKYAGTYIDTVTFTVSVETTANT